VDDLVVLHCHQIWPDSNDHAGIDIFRFDDDGRIVEHWDVLQVIAEGSENTNGLFGGARHHSESDQRREPARCASHNHRLRRCGPRAQLQALRPRLSAEMVRAVVMAHGTEDVACAESMPILRWRDAAEDAGIAGLDCRPSACTQHCCAITHQSNPERGAVRVVEEKLLRWSDQSGDSLDLFLQMKLLELELLYIEIVRGRTPLLHLDIFRQRLMLLAELRQMGTHAHVFLHAASEQPEE
jgi:hypothetical protein